VWNLQWHRSNFLGCCDADKETLLSLRIIQYKIWFGEDSRRICGWVTPPSGNNILLYAILFITRAIPLLLKYRKWRYHKNIKKCGSLKNDDIIAIVTWVIKRPLSENENRNAFPTAAICLKLEGTFQHKFLEIFITRFPSHKIRFLLNTT
jgi:hypothetical protein